MRLASLKWLGIAKGLMLAFLSPVASYHDCDAAIPISITNTADLARFTCSTYQGSITVASIPVPSISPSNVTPIPTVLLLSQLETVGNLQFSGLGWVGGDGPWTISLPKIRSVGELVFMNVTNLQMPPLESLKSATTIAFDNAVLLSPASLMWNSSIDGYNNGSGSWQHLKSLTSMSFIHTNIVGIGPLSLKPDQEDGAAPNRQITIYARNNSMLSSVELFGLNTAYTRIDIRNNAANLNISLPDISNASLRIEGVASFQAPSLTRLSESDSSDEPMSMSGSSFTNLSLPNLSLLGGQLRITNNPNLESVSFPVLDKADSLSITGNVRLKSIDLQDLSQLEKTVFIHAPLTNLNLTNLKGLDGKLTIASSGTFQCDSLDSRSFPSGQYKCKDDATSNYSPDQPKPSSSSSSPAGLTSRNSKLSKGAKIGIGVGVGLGAALVLVGAFVICLHKRRINNRSLRSAVEGEYPMSEHRQLDQSSAPYAKVPLTPGSAEERSSEEQRPVSSELGDNWTPPEQKVPTTDGRVELEEQQGARHEMDARSLPDMDVDDDEEDTRSLQDIERAHGHI